MPVIHDKHDKIALTELTIRETFKQIPYSTDLATERLKFLFAPEIVLYGVKS